MRYCGDIKVVEQIDMAVRTCGKSVLLKDGSDQQQDSQLPDGQKPAYFVKRYQVNCNGSGEAGVRVHFDYRGEPIGKIEFRDDKAWAIACVVPGLPFLMAKLVPAVVYERHPILTAMDKLLDADICERA